MIKDQIDAVLDRVRSWPEEDQEEFIAIAREIEARRAGIYVMTDDECVAIADARESAVVPDEEAKEFWKRRGIS